MRFLKKTLKSKGISPILPNKRDPSTSERERLETGAFCRIDVCSGIILLIVGVSLPLCLLVFLLDVESGPPLVLPESSLPFMVAPSMSQLRFP